MPPWQRIAATFGPALVILLVGVVAYRAVRDSERHMDLVERAHQVDESLHEVLAQLANAETAERGYIVTGDERFLEPYRGVREEVAQALDRLRAKMIEENQRERLARLAPLVYAKLEQVEHNIELRRAGEVQAARAAVQLGEGRTRMEAVRALIAEMERAQRQVIAERGAVLRAEIRGLYLVLVIGIPVAVLLAWLANLILRRYARAQERLAADLQMQRDVLEDQTEELQTQAAQLEEAQAELEMANDELQTANRALRESEERYRALAEVDPDGILVMDAESVILSANPAVERIFGYRAGELVGQPMAMLIPERMREAHRLGVRRYMTTGKRNIPWTGVELPGLRKDGSEVPLEISFGEYTEAGERVFAGFMRDISERKAAEAEREALLEREHQARKEAEEANRAKSEFLSAMSHELRTPLNAIAGYVDLLEAGIHGPVSAAQTKALDRVKRNEESLLALINDILNYAKIEAGRVEYRTQEIRVEDLLRGMEALIEPQVNAAGLKYVCDLPEEGLTAWGDPEKVEQVLVNLLTNAIKFTPAGGRVTLSAEADADGVHLRVSDTGRGIPEEMLPTIFDPFVQVDRHRIEDSRQGVGLGLAISRDLARGMGGDLTVRSMVGEGSTFTLTIPRTDRAAPIGATLQDDEDRREGERRDGRERRAPSMAQQ